MKSRTLPSSARASLPSCDDCRNEGDHRRTATGRFRPGVHAYRAPKLHWDRAWLEREYSEKGRSASEIAAVAGCNENNILFWLQKHSIHRRAISQVRALKHWGLSGAANPMFRKFGRLNPNYVDGRTPERQRQYGRSKGKEFLRAVFARDKDRCVRCGACRAGPRSLHAHHIKPWDAAPKLRFDLANAVTLCRGCHRWVHSKKNVAREYLA